jgi:hypothetical protein
MTENIANIISFLIMVIVPLVVYIIYLIDLVYYLRKIVKKREDERDKIAARYLNYKEMIELERTDLSLNSKKPWGRKLCYTPFR